MTAPPTPYTVECPICHAQQTALLLDDGTSPKLQQIRTTQTGLNAIAHLPTCPRRHHQHNTKTAANCQSPLF